MKIAMIGNILQNENSFQRTSETTKRSPQDWKLFSPRVPLNMSARDGPVFLEG
jgi:hypothetical protein